MTLPNDLKQSLIIHYKFDLNLALHQSPPACNPCVPIFKRVEESRLFLQKHTSAFSIQQRLWSNFSKTAAS